MFLSPTDMTGRTLAQIQADPTVRALALTTLPSPSLTLPAGGFTARYVRVQLPGTNALSLAEVQVFGPA